MAEDVMPDDIPVVVDRRVSFDRDFAVCGVDPGDNQLTVVMAIARSSGGEVVVLDEMRVDAPLGMTADELYASLTEYASALERTKAVMDDFKVAADREFSQFGRASYHLKTDVDAERLVRAETLRYYTNPPASTTAYYVDDPDQTEDLAVRTILTTNSRGRWRRTKTKRCMKCIAIVNDGQTSCHRCGCRRIH